MKLSNQQNKFLRARAHSLNVVLTIGAKGLSSTLKEEAEITLAKHELIKVKLPAIDKKDKRAMLNILANESGAEVVQLIGRVGILYRAGKPAIITLP